MRFIATILVFATMPVMAAPPILTTDFLQQGEQLFAATFSRGTSDSKGSVGENSGIDWDSTGSSRDLELRYALGVSDKQLLSLRIPYMFKEENSSDFTDGFANTSINTAFDGLGDLQAEYRLLLANANSSRVAAWLEASIPVGDDDSGDAEIVQNGVKTQSLKKGGAGSGRTDYEAGLSFSTKMASNTFYSSVGYIIYGTKTEEGEKEVLGDNVYIDVGVLHEIDTRSNIRLGAGYLYSGEDSFGEDEGSSVTAYMLGVGLYYQPSHDTLISPQLRYITTSKQTIKDSMGNTIITQDELNVMMVGLGVKKTF